MRNLARLTRERHAKFANTFYHLEPNVKETPGGLRDFQLVCWLSGFAARPTAAQAPEIQEVSTSWRGCAVTCTARPAATTTC